MATEGEGPICVPLHNAALTSNSSASWHAVILDFFNRSARWLASCLQLALDTTLFLWYIRLRGADNTIHQPPHTTPHLSPSPAETVPRPSLRSLEYPPALPLRAVPARARLPPKPAAKAKPPTLSNAVSAASTEMPLEGLPSNVSSESRKVVHRKQSSDGAQTMEALIGSVDIRVLRPSHRRCASSVSAAGSSTATRTSTFAGTLRHAVLRKEVNSVNALLQGWANRDVEAEDILINQTDDEGYNLMHCAVSSKCAKILTTLLDILPSDEARQRAAQSYGKSSNRYSPLHLASLRQDYDGAQILLANGADPNAKSKLETTPLHLAVSKGNVEIAKLLLEHGADPNAVTQVGNVPLLSAVHKRSAELVEILLAAGGNPRASFQNGASPRAVALGMNAVDLLVMMDGSVKSHGHRRTSSVARNEQI